MYVNTNKLKNDSFKGNKIKNKIRLFVQSKLENCVNCKRAFCLKTKKLNKKTKHTNNLVCFNEMKIMMTLQLLLL